MKRILSLTIVFLFLTSCVTFSPRFCPEGKVSLIRQHTVSIAVYYVMSDNQYHTWQTDPDNQFHGIITTPVAAQYPDKAAAIIGSGTILRDNYVMTVRHMVDDHYGVGFSNIYVFIPGFDHPVQADLVCKSPGDNFYDDYAVLKLREDAGLPGLRVAEKQPVPGEKVIFTGSTGGFAFFSRFGHVTELQWHFRTDNAGILHLTTWEEFPYMCVFPGGPGDSGGSICNVKGELAGIMYCGLTNYSEEYIFANPLDMLRKFLLKNNLGFLL